MNARKTGLQSSMQARKEEPFKGQKRVRFTGVPAMKVAPPRPPGVVGGVLPRNRPISSRETVVSHQKLSQFFTKN